MPVVTTELDFGSTFQLLVAVVLSAQCTDKRINQVTPDLFAHDPDAKSMAKADEEDVFEWIRSVSYPNAKAKHLVELARILAEKYDGEVPSNYDDLLSLPGVGRKTANVIQSVAFGKATLAVDTHVLSRCSPPTHGKVVRTVCVRIWHRLSSICILACSASPAAVS